MYAYLYDHLTVLMSLLHDYLTVLPSYLHDYLTVLLSYLHDYLAVLLNYLHASLDGHGAVPSRHLHAQLHANGTIRQRVGVNIHAEDTKDVSKWKVIYKVRKISQHFGSGTSSSPPSHFPSSVPFPNKPSKRRLAEQQHHHRYSFDHTIRRMEPLTIADLAPTTVPSWTRPHLTMHQRALSRMKPQSAAYFNSWDKTTCFQYVRSCNVLHHLANEKP